MTPEQQVRLEIIRWLVQPGMTLTRQFDIEQILKQADQLVDWVLARTYKDLRHDPTLLVEKFKKEAGESPLRIKVHTDTGIPVEFS